LRLVNRHQQKPNFRFFGIFFVGFRFFSGYFNTDVGVGFGFLKYRDIGFGLRLPVFGYRLGSTLHPENFNNLYSSTTQQTDTNRQTDKIQLTNTTNTKLRPKAFYTFKIKSEQPKVLVA